MTGPKGNIEVELKQNSLFPAEPVIKCFVIPPNSKLEKNREEIVCFTPAGSQICRGFKKHGLITCESKVRAVFPRELVSFVCPRELLSFDPRHVTRSPLIGKRL